MKKRLLFFFAIAVAMIALIVILWLQGSSIAVLNPQGIIAEKQRNLLAFAVVLSMVIILPVFALLFFISWKYRESNIKAKYRPNWSESKALEGAWWGVPCLIIIVLSVITWQSSHDLDPYKPIESTVKPVTIQVVALQWKWLFLYPEQQVASVNYVRFPEKTPLNFVLTADAPMNSFWIPSLGGQKYAMSGMSTKLHLMAGGIGTYEGKSTNISGEGYAKMVFTAESTSTGDFDAWVKTMQQSPELSMDAYNTLAKPDVPDNPMYYALSETNLYGKIMMKYMMPGHENEDRSEPLERSAETSDAPVQQKTMRDHAGMEMTPAMEGQ